MLKNPLPALAKGPHMAPQEGPFSRKPSLKSKSRSLLRSLVIPHVGIIGGGMAGLACALSLDQKGVKSTVFDTGIHGLGGRMGTRIIDPQPLIFDHAAQFFTVSDSRFGQLVDGWLERGLVRRWEGMIGELEVGGRFVPFPSSPPRYVGINGMRPLADSLLTQTSLVNVVRPCWISKLEPFNGMWHLSENGKPRGQFDIIIIAHNGKCANRLLGSSGLPLIARQMKRLELSSIWALLAAFEDPLPIGGEFTFEGAFVKGVDSLSWMANNSMKLLGSQSNGPQCWTFFSTAAYGKQNKVPQENIPTATAEKVKTGMLHGVETALGLPKSSLQKPLYTRVQLWGAALPTNTPSIPCIFDPHGRAGICGDWLLGSSLECAALSGMALANHIVDYLQSGGVRPEEFSVGLHNDFRPLEGHDIGQFPGYEDFRMIRWQNYCTKVVIGKVGDTKHDSSPVRLNTKPNSRFRLLPRLQKQERQNMWSSGITLHEKTIHVHCTLTTPAWGFSARHGGLVCAFSLDKKGVKSTVFDTGIHGLGGRMGTRIIDPQPWIFDHAAQFFTVTDSWFGELERGKSNSFVLPVMAENFLIPGADIFANGPQCWTFFRTAAFGKQNKVPEENIPTATAEKVKTDMLEGVEAALGLQKCSLQKPFYTRVNYGVQPFWLTLQVSHVSLTLMEGLVSAVIGFWVQIVDYLQSGRVCPEEFAVGLHNEFRPLEGYDIGQFPGLESMEK
ncbi:hypothetical protein Patl1_23267 [Pistacia atlantica]|uniref:Uncharacterized protein n=1 Tax=Pistacia atlantica TaxID=434234 RepID=A0ACC0ZZE8_9ROSI|nr:hypothetical protein Patl1_23267 [Pistacia atlantica]